ncbi:chromate efflux transporter [Caenispirillum bisanense]|uniref:chromate efflux transporter n=1 Tax=Caenispirillum bisanense TaxID=414052 RepID=UPI0031D449E5
MPEAKPDPHPRPSDHPPPRPRLPTLAEATRTWARVAALSFGGPAGQIAVMHRILVEEKRWIGEGRFLHALNYCMLLPGPEAQQLAVYIGWLLNRTAGGLVAGILFVLPGFLAILALSLIYAAWGEVGWVNALFFGLKAAVLAIVIQALLRVGRKALKGPAMAAIAAAAFVAIYAFNVPFPVIVLTAAVLGFLGGRLGRREFAAGGGHGGGGAAGPPDSETALGDGIPDHARRSVSWALRIAGIFLTLWLVPVAVLIAVLGPDDVFSRIALFFSQMAVVTFGGAYAVLAYVAQQAVETYGWLQPGEMLDGLGMAETTPGPLIMVVQFVGFLGAFRDPGGLDPYVAGTLAAVLTTWVTFTPCFLWIFLGAPWVEALRGNRAVAGSLAAVTAAVVGVILNLFLWFTVHTLFAEVDRLTLGPLTLDWPQWRTVDVAAAALAAGALVATFRFRVGMMPLLLGCSLAGLALHLAFGVAG